MSFLRKKDASKPRKPHQSIPVTRYYSPQKVKNKKQTNKLSNNQDSKKFVNHLLSFIKLLPQKIFAIAIITIIILNTTVSSVSVKIQNSVEHQYRPLEVYNEGVKEILNDSILNKSKFTLSSKEFETRITEMYPEISRATAIVPLAGRKLKVGLVMDPPLLRLLGQDNKQGIVGESGKLLILTDANSILSTFSAYSSILIEPVVSFQQGDQVLTSIETELIKQLTNEFDGTVSYKPKPSSVRFLVEKRELHVRFEGKTFFAKLTPERDASLQIGALISTLKQLEQQGSTPIEYIDVRVEERVFVK